MAVQILALKTIHIRNFTVIRGVIMPIGHHDLVEVMELNLVCDYIFTKNLQTVRLDNDLLKLIF